MYSISLEYKISEEKRHGLDCKKNVQTSFILNQALERAEREQALKIQVQLNYSTETSLLLNSLSFFVYIQALFFFFFLAKTYKHLNTDNLAVFSFFNSNFWSVICRDQKVGAGLPMAMFRAP